MNAKENISKATVQLILKQPFFACLAMRMKYVPADVKTCVTDGKCIEYNPEYFENLPTEELKGVLAHEILHTVMLHHTRRNKRDQQLWNKATDYAINPLLVSSGFVLPQDHLINNDFAGKAAEQIYALLPAPEPQNNGDPKGNDDEPGGIGDVKDPPPGTNIQEAEAELMQIVAQAAMLAKNMGKLPDHLNRFINEILQPKIDWREVLARFVAEITKNDYTWTKPSTRYLHMGLYLPSLESPETGKIILMVDTSGSIDDDLINQFAGEVQDIAKTFNTDLQVIYIDTEVQGIQDIERDETVRLEPMGGGGTDFRPGFDYIEEHDLQPKAVVYLTDGCCHQFPTPPDYAVLWAIFGDYDFVPPFGETIRIDTSQTIKN